MEFRTGYDSYISYSESGSRFAPIYSTYFDDFGVLRFEEVGEEDLYTEIQSHAESVDINYILARYEMGETDVLSKVQGFYADVSDMPKTYTDVLNSVLKSEQFFEELPVSVKQEFNNSFSEFMAALGTEDFAKRFNMDVPPAVAQAATDDVKDGDNDE